MLEQYAPLIAHERCVQPVLDQLIERITLGFIVRDRYG